MGSIAFGGVGQAMMDIGSANQKAWLDDENTAKRQQRDSAYALDREKTIMALKTEIANAPLQRIGTKAQEFAGQDVPQEAAPVTTLSGVGAPAYPDGSASSGLQGDPAALRAQISKWPDGPDKTDALAQLDKQLLADREQNAGLVAGKMRKRTPDEALDAAVQDAKVNDLPAYADYEAKVGKPKRDERRIDVAERRDEERARAAQTSEERRAQADARKWEIDLKRLELQQGGLDAQNRRIDALIEHWERSDENKSNPKAPTADRMGSIVNAMNATIKNLDAEPPRKTAPQAEQDEWKAQRANAVAVRARAMARLNSNFDDGATPAPAAAPAASPASAPAARPPLSQFFR